MSKRMQAQSTEDFPSSLIGCYIHRSAWLCVMHGFTWFGSALQQKKQEYLKMNMYLHMK